MKITICPVVAVSVHGKTVIARHIDGHAQLAADSHDVGDNERSARQQLDALVRLVAKRREQHPRLGALLTRL